MTPKPLPGAVVEPVSLELAWSQCNIYTEGSPPESAHDAWLELVGIPGAREAAERFTGCAFTVKSYQVLMSRFPDEIEIPMAPLRSVDLITYVDAAGETQALGTGDFEVDETGLLAVVRPVGRWPETDGSAAAVEIQFTVGYEPEDVPRDALWAILLLLGHAFRNREALADKQQFDMPIGVESLLRPHRLRLGMA